ncbi:MAG: hypothetical protein HY717_23975 [Planctomycetes bacterium]|nr:hypothetical protein [Planctomycetota bacterium]
MTDTPPARERDPSTSLERDRFQSLDSLHPIPLEGEEHSFFKHFPQFFIFPLVLVTIGVLLYVFFIAAAEDRRTVSALLSDIQNSSWPHQSRYRAAYELARQAAELERDGKKLSTEDTGRLLAILDLNRQDETLRKWILFTLGRAGDEALALSELIRTAQSPSSPPEEKVYAIYGLGLSRAPEAAPILLAELEKFTGEGSAEARQITLAALANIGLSPRLDPARQDPILKALEKSLEDPHWSISWNSSIILGTQFKNAAGKGLLLKILDRKFLSEKIARADDQDYWIARAIEALRRMGDQGPETRARIESLSQDPSMKVRNEVFRYRESLKR